MGTDRVIQQETALRDELKERLQFEMLLAEISARFVNLPAGEVDTAIEDAQRLICERLDLDRSALWQRSTQEPDLTELTHLYEKEDCRMILEKPESRGHRAGEWLVQDGESKPVYLQVDSRSFFSRLIRKLDETRTLVIPDVDALPDELTEDRASLQRFKTRSTVIVALDLGEGSSGLLTFASIRRRRDWPADLVKRFCLVADIFANVLARRRVEQALRESENRLNLTIESARAGLWIMDSTSSSVWVNPILRELFHFAPDQEIRYQSFFEVIHPEDRAQVHQTVEESMKSEAGFRCDYRIQAPDGDIRWIISRWRKHPRGGGKTDLLMGVSFDVTDRKRNEEALQRSYAEIKALKDRLQAETEYLRAEVVDLKEGHEIVGRSPAIRRVLEQIEQVAPTDATVLIQGETGTGKELIARAIHRLSRRGPHTMIVVNCGSLPEGLIESELFGREKGAYTDALTRQAGRFELAHQSTLFLDEIGDLPPGLQAKLLRVLQEGTFERLGSTKTLTVDARIIAATNRDLAADVAAGKFRQDLYYRLSVFPIQAPPLRERREDIPALVRVFVAEFAQKMGKEIDSIPKRSMSALAGYSWPGNIRELRNVIEHAVIVSRGRTLEVHNPGRQAQTATVSLKLEEAMAQHILEVLERTSWRVKGPDGAAELLGLKPTTLFSKMKKLGLPSRSQKYEKPE